jgi:hypothetical protein
MELQESTNVGYRPRMDTNAGTVARRISDAIDTAERSRKWTAVKAGIPATTFARKLDGFGDFTVSEVWRIAKALELAPGDLLPDEFARRVA